MAFDPSVISDIGASGPDFAGSTAKAFQLKDLINEEQLSSLKLAGAKQSASEQNAAKDIFKSSDISTEKGIAEASEKLTRAGQPDKAMELRKYGQQAASGELDNQIKQLEIADKSMGSLVSVVDPIVAKADELRRSGQPDAMIQAYIQAQTPLAIMQLEQSGLPPQAMQKIHALMQQGPITYDKLKSIDSGNKQGQQMIKSRLDELRVNTASKAQDEHTRHDERMEELTAQRQGTGDSAQNDKVSAVRAAMADSGVSFPSGMRSEKAQRDTIAGQIKAHPDDSPQQIAQRVKNAQIAMGGAKTEENVLARREAAILPVEKSITKPGGFLDQAEKAVNEVDFPKLKAAGGFESWTKEQESDPSLTAYKAAVAELRAEYSIVLSKGGQVTDAARHEAAKVIPDLITKDQFKRIKQTVMQGIESSKSGVEESISQTEGKSVDHPPAIQSLLDKYK